MPADNSAIARQVRSERFAARRAEIVRLRQDGLTPGEIAEALAVTRRTVQNALIEAGIRSSHARKCGDAADRRQQIIELDGQGLAAPVIADKLKVSLRSIQRARSDAGLAAPQRFATEDEKLQAKIMLEDGASYGEVARTLGRGAKTVATWFPGYHLGPSERAERARMGRTWRRLESAKYLQKV